LARLYRLPRELCIWLRTLRMRHVYMLVSHPHHYVTAAGLTALLVMAGHYETGAILAAWCYALVENISTAVDRERESHRADVLAEAEREVIDEQASE
jgi:hypothetical protein